MKRWIVSAGLAGLILGIGLGRSATLREQRPERRRAPSLPEDRPPSQGTARPAAALPPRPRDPSLAQPACDAEPLRRRVSQLEAKLREGSSASGSSGSSSAPVPFPNGAEDHPDAFRRTIDAVLSECQPDLSLSDLDCSEYPCIAWTRWKSSGTHRFDLSGCRPWTSRYPEQPVAMSAFTADSDGGIGDGYVGFFAFPADPALAAAARSRARERMQAMLEAYGVTR